MQLDSGTVTALSVLVTAVVVAVSGFFARRDAAVAKEAAEAVKEELEAKAKFDKAVEERHQQDKEEELARIAREKAEAQRDAIQRRRITDEVLADMQASVRANQEAIGGVDKKADTIVHQTNSLAAAQAKLAEEQAARIQHLEEAILNRENNAMREEIRKAVTEALAELRRSDG